MRKWLKAIREEANLSKSAVSGRLAVSAPYYCEIERGTRQQDMTYSMMERLASALNVPVQTIIDAETEYREMRITK